MTAPSENKRPIAARFRHLGVLSSWARFENCDDPIHVRYCLGVEHS
jgi:hypothetical protein